MTYAPPNSSVAPRAPEINPLDVVLVTYPDTLDGFLAAWTVRKIGRSYSIPLEMQLDSAPVPPMEGRNWICLADYHFPAAPSSKSILVFGRFLGDFGEGLPFNKWKRTHPFGIETMAAAGRKYAFVTDAHRSLCVSTWNFFHAAKLSHDYSKLPALLKAVEKVVLGIASDADIVLHAAVGSYPRDFRTIDKLVDDCEDRYGLERLMGEGAAILRDRAKTST